MHLYCSLTKRERKEKNKSPLYCHYQFWSIAIHSVYTTKITINNSFSQPILTGMPLEGGASTHLPPAFFFSESPDVWWCRSPTNPQEQRLAGGGVKQPPPPLQWRLELWKTPVEIKMNLTHTMLKACGKTLHHHHVCFHESQAHVWWIWMKSNLNTSRKKVKEANRGT